MNDDILSVARRLSAWAEEPALPSQKREDLKSAVDMIRTLHQMLNAARPREQEARQ